MPMHNGLLPREGLKADVFARLLSNTAFNPLVTLPLLLLARFTRRGQDLGILHHTALSRVRALFYIGVARWLSSWYSAKVLNNWTTDQYDWRGREIVLITGGSGGIGAHVVRFLSEKASTVHYFKCDITSPKEIAAVAKEIRAQVGDPTVLINNAGVARGKSILDSTERDVRFTMDVNTLSHYWMVQEFLPSMIENNHGMVVTVASIASWVTVPNMVDYAASKAAALSFHEGLTAELSTRYGAPKVRTVVVNQGYTKTPLFEGYNNSKGFLLPTLEPETVAEAIVRQVLSGQSGQVICPTLASALTGLAAMPHWYQYNMRKDGAEIMPTWRGRQVVQDLDKFYEAKEKDVEGSTVLVPEESK
ncbi:NAD(P)-binding protein [Cryphonectria parasitica EP155]|uniref:Short-chain dehydrogenase/reductase 3 n=1 Tax=Cryphonectria parasitica (strain ATCC 38755 / EP155) TaxID=660469 RepID=A0A9P5CRV4_CRYP1|nr:NAD(P)-binding protein [Cryphonectria parasitica EP155]KAF3768964.1 NAD(P)-binding protein [Cryphonectria parasitica EP155]